METKKQIDLLTHLGLTPNSSRIYISLVQTGPASAKEISKNTQIATQDVYRLLPALEKIGIVEKKIETPTRFEACPVRQAIEHLLRENEAKQQNLQEEVQKVLMQIAVDEKHKELSTSTEGETLGILSGISLLHKIRNASNKAQDYCATVTTFERLIKYLPILSDEMENAKKRGVKCMFVVAIESKDLNSPVFESRQFKKVYVDGLLPPLKFMTEPVKAILWVCDDKEAAIDLSPGGKFTEEPAFWTNNKVLVFLASHYFEDMWKNSKTLDQIKNTFKRTGNKN